MIKFLVQTSQPFEMCIKFENSDILLLEKN